MIPSGSHLPDSQPVTGTACSPWAARGFCNALSHRPLSARQKHCHTAQPHMNATHNATFKNKSHAVTGPGRAEIPLEGSRTSVRGGLDTLTRTKKSSETDVSELLVRKWQLPTLPPGGAVPSAMVSLTSLFGMGRGGSSPL